MCAANICRSVMVERMLRRDAAARGLDIDVTSCGILFDGEPASDTVIAVLEERDMDARDHSSRRFVPGLLEGVDLVVTMERMHARELAVTLDGSSSRIHTLGAFVGWLEANPGAGGAPPERVAAFAATRKAADLLGGGPDEVEDPHGRFRRHYRRAADRLELLAASLLDGLYGPSPAED
ncbi:MAG: hypothetical protein P8J50_05615 [Acidimicrobiales bacterium]|nr:hypothetical protein [Acidimicrobiales bacterium]